MAQGVQYDLTHDKAIEQGATYDEITFVWADSGGTPIDITGYTVEMDIKENIEATTPLAQFSSTTGDFVLGGILGTIQFSFTSAKTMALDFTTAIYDLFLLGPLDVPARRIVYGQVQLIPNVTDF